MIGAFIAEKGFEVVVIAEEICGAKSPVKAEGGLGVTHQGPSRDRIKTKCSSCSNYEQEAAEEQKAIAELCSNQIEKRLGRPLSVVSCQLFKDLHVRRCPLARDHSAFTLAGMTGST